MSDQPKRKPPQRSSQNRPAKKRVNPAEELKRQQKRTNPNQETSRPVRKTANQKPVRNSPERPVKKSAAQKPTREMSTRTTKSSSVKSTGKPTKPVRNKTQPKNTTKSRGSTSQGKKEKGKSSGLLIMLLLLLALAGGAWFFMNNSKEPISNNVIPAAINDLPRKTITDFDPCDQFKQKNINCSIEKQKNDQFPRGRLIKQEPAANTPYDESTAVKLLYSEGPESTQIPSIKGEQVEDAKTRLYQLGLNATATKEVDVPSVPQGRAVGIDKYKVGQEVPNGTEMVVLVSSGFVNVPNWVGKDLKTAQLSAQSLGIKITSKEVKTFRYKPGTIFWQSVAEGRSPYMDHIELQIARRLDAAGSDIPDVVGKELSEAILTLRNKGFKNIKVIETKNPEEESSPIEVLSIDPAPGTLATRETLITIVKTRLKKD